MTPPGLWPGGTNIGFNPAASGRICPANAAWPREYPKQNQSIAMVPRCLGAAAPPHHARGLPSAAPRAMIAAAPGFGLPEPRTEHP